MGKNMSGMADGSKGEVNDRESSSYEAVRRFGVRFWGQPGRVVEARTHGDRAWCSPVLGVVVSGSARSGTGASAGAGAARLHLWTAAGACACAWLVRLVGRGREWPRPQLLADDEWVGGDPAQAWQSTGSPAIPLFRRSTMSTVAGVCNFYMSFGSRFTRPISTLRPANRSLILGSLSRLFHPLKHAGHGRWSWETFMRNFNYN